MNVVEFALTQGKVALVNTCDLELLESRGSWHANLKNSGWYAFDSRRVAMHRVIRGIIGAPRHTVVDHINGDGLDNRRCNLRVCSQGYNTRMQPTKAGRCRGVVEIAPGKFVARLSLPRSYSRRCKYLGQFGSREEACLAYREAARSLLMIDVECLNCDS